MRTSLRPRLDEVFVARGVKLLGTKDKPIDLDKVTVKLQPGLDADTANRYHLHTPSLASSIAHEQPISLRSAVEKVVAAVQDVLKARRCRSKPVVVGPSF